MMAQATLSPSVTGHLISPVFSLKKVFHILFALIQLNSFRFGCLNIGWPRPHKRKQRRGN